MNGSRSSRRWRLGLCLLPLASVIHAATDSHWNQWLGGPARTLSVTDGAKNNRAPVFTELWRRPVGSGFAGLSVFGTNAITAMTDGRNDVAILLNPATGAERWRFPLGRTKKRAEGVPLGPLSTPALDAESAYAQALDGRFVCLNLSTGQARWELNLKRAFKAYEPGYGFASSPLLLDDLVVLQPAGASSFSVVALDRGTGSVRWTTPLGTATEYASATWLQHAEGGQVVAHLGTKLAGLAATDGRKLWELEDVAGGLWTASVLAGQRIFFPTAGQARLLEPAAQAVRVVWTSPVFESAMGPVVELDGMLIGHHERRLTALDAVTGRPLWRRPEETDGQLIALGRWLVFVNDRAGTLEIFSVTRRGCEAAGKQTVFKPTRMETPLSFARDTLYLRAPDELVALRNE